MRFSVLVPVYNVEAYLDDCIQSILNQSYSDYELVLVDDGSTDNSGKICDIYKDSPRVQVIHKKNNGLISARRTALQKAVGEYIIFCDSDDMLEKDALYELNSIIEDTNADIVLYNMYIYNNVKTPMFKHLFQNKEYISRELICKNLLLNYQFNSLCSKTCKRTLFDIDVDYSEFYSYNFGEDLLQSTPVFLNAKRIVYLDKALYDYRYSSGMMRKYSSNYFDSYKNVGNHVTNLLSKLKIDDLYERKAIFILNAAYGQIMQYKYCKLSLKKDVELLLANKEFQDAYNIIFENKSNYIENLSVKKKIVLFLIKNRNIALLEIIILFSKLINSIQRD